MSALTEPTSAATEDREPRPAVASGAARRRLRRRRRIRIAISSGCAVVVLAAVAVAALGLGGGAPPAPSGGTQPPATAQVTRTTLVQTLVVNGVLGYGATATVVARASAATDSDDSDTGSTTNTITWLPVPGTVIGPGQPVFKVDNRPVVLVAGDLPLFRILAGGVVGDDVKMLETNLAAFGYTGFTVDTSFTDATASAVSRWQRDLGLQQTGTVDVNQVVVASGAMRVAGHETTVGADASGPVLTYTGTTRLVTVALPVTNQHLVSPDLQTTITLPDGTTVTGTVASIGTVAVAESEDTDVPGAGVRVPTVDVLVTIADQAALSPIDTAPVQVALVTGTRENVLTVPVNALLALAEGGYGVQVVEGSTTRYVAVQTGMFANGRVEISGTGIDEGTTVGVPA